MRFRPDEEGVKPNPKKSFFLLGKAGIPKNQGKTIVKEKKKWSWTEFRLDVDDAVYKKFPILKDRTPSPIFKNLTFYFNGRGDETVDESFLHLAKLAKMHGASIERFVNSKITHVICTNYIKEREKMKYVHPKWITACIEKQELIKEDEFIIKHDRILK